MIKNPSGFRDLDPEDAQLKEEIIGKIIAVYQSYGFKPLETPIVEFASVLRGEVSDFNLFLVNPSKERKKGEAQELAMRFDLTVPLARVMAKYQHFPKPFKRYQLGEVFRGERPQKGRYREFTQLDADIVGSSSIYADIDMLLMMHRVMQSLDLGDFLIRVNTRKVLNALPKLAMFPENQLRDVLIILDKKEKISQEELKEMLAELHFDEGQINKIVSFANIAGSRKEVLEKLKELFHKTKEAEKGIQDLERIDSILSLFEDKKNIIFDMSIIRGLAYYTGAIFETQIQSHPEYGSVYSGGHYDHLIEKLGGPALPAVGASVGIDRLLEIVREKRNSQERREKKAYAILVYEEAFLPYAMEIAEKLRKSGIVADLHYAQGPIGKQYAYAEFKHYEKVILVGREANEKRIIHIKNIETREEEKIPFQTEFFKNE